MDNQQKFLNSKEVIGFLVEQFPACFSIKGDAKPLKIGIFQDLATRLENEERVSKTLLRSSLRHYTNSWRYLHCIKKGSQRVDLDGKDVAVIEDEHVEHAKNARLRAIECRCKCVAVDPRNRNVCAEPIDQKRT